MTGTKPLSLHQTLQQDMAVLNARGPNNVLKLLRLLGRAGFLAVVLHRLGAAAFQRGRVGRVLAALLARLNQFLNGCDISNQAVIGPGFKLSHPYGVVIGLARIGSNVMMLQNTTLGMRRFSDPEADPALYPIIGDHVVICCGAVVVGPVRVGDHATIGANAVVLTDVPAGSTAIGVPARIAFSHRAAA